jgi:ferric-dicitrate binding protein FerR (iron transport regulator)
METSVEGRPAVRDYLIRRARPPHVRAVCMLIAVVALASSAIWLDPMRARYYETAAGQYRTINCANSSITLSAQSRIAIQCTRGLVRVRLLRGEASFRTTQDPSRSTLVLTGDAQVHDFGSKFSVRRSADRSTVTVVEGFVELSVLYPGQGGSTPPAGGSGAAQQLQRMVDEKPVWAGESATVLNAGSELVLGPRRIVYAPATIGVIG